jgi:uncharacterized membrane protein
MRTPYNFIAGQSVERLTALCDGVFAVAMTLLVLDLHVPATEMVEQIVKTTHQNNEYVLWSQLAPLGFRFIPYIMSFLTLGVFWIAQQTQLNYLIARSNRHLTWIHIGFLLAVTLIPFRRVVSRVHGLPRRSGGLLIQHFPDRPRCSAAGTMRCGRG